MSVHPTLLTLFGQCILQNPVKRAERGKREQGSWADSQRGLMWDWEPLGRTWLEALLLQ